MSDSPTSLSSEAATLLANEETILNNAVASLEAQRSADASRLRIENVRARELTSELVAAHRDEDKAMLASNEAVSHAMARKKLKDVKLLDRQIEKPYFARMVLDEKGREIEYKLGFAANSDCRIIDWRRAPISRLYYEYREGEEYSEEIQGQEREGTIILRNSVEIEKRTLKRVTCKLGTFTRSADGWTKADSGSSGSSHHQKGGLPHILSLISAEQFKTITEDNGVPLLIQGVAGSGKTTVALHRLAWLLAEGNSELEPEEALVLVLSPTLKAYVSGTLPAMDIEGVRVLTFEEWAASLFKLCKPELLCEDGRVARPADRTPASIERVMRSMSALQMLESLCKSSSALAADPLKALTSIFEYPRELIELDETHLINKDLVEVTHKRLLAGIAGHTLDRAADALVLRCLQLANTFTGLAGYAQPGHVVADEVQDYSPVDLACVLAAVKEPGQLTMVGDTAQSLDRSSAFPGWEKLKNHWQSKDSISRFITLKVSHRSTQPIMRLADHIQNRPATSQGRAGRVPLWFKCRGEEYAVQCAMKWLLQAVQRYPDALTAVICRDAQIARMLYGLLRPGFGPGLRLGQDEDFSFEEGIVVTDISKVRGLEFVNVLIWNPAAKDYPSDPEHRNLLYVAVTRSSENACLVSHGRASALLPPPGSPLLRCVEEEPPPEDNPQ